MTDETTDPDEQDDVIDGGVSEGDEIEDEPAGGTDDEADDDTATEADDDTRHFGGP